MIDQDKLLENVGKELPIKEMYSDLLKPSFSRLGKLGDDILKFVALPFTFLGMTADELELKYKGFVSQAINKVPEEKRIKPSPLVAGPLLEHVKYLFNEEKEIILQKMFAELLGNASNSDIKEQVQPSYVHTLKQLTWKEAELLQLIYKHQEDIRCLGVIFRRLNNVDKDYISVFSEKAEPLLEWVNDEEEVISNVFYEYYIPVVQDKFEMADRKLLNALNVLMQLNLVESFTVNKYKNEDKYSLEMHSIINVDKFDSSEIIKAYTLTGYANNLMELCISPEDNVRTAFMCNECVTVFQNVQKRKQCPVCGSNNVKLL